MSPILSMLLQDEALRLKPYLDTKQKITIGIGRCLETDGITAEEAIYLAQNDIVKFRKAAGTFPWFEGLDPVRQDIVVMMIFNIGLSGFCEFKRLISAMGLKQYDQAASEMLASTWSSQVKGRAVKLAGMMRSGAYPT